MILFLFPATCCTVSISVGSRWLVHTLFFVIRHRSLLHFDERDLWFAAASGLS